LGLGRLIVFFAEVITLSFEGQPGRLDGLDGAVTLDQGNDVGRVTPDMAREQKRRNLIAALEKSGFTIRPDVKQEDEGGLT
jgi:hypothetical protein